MMKESNNQYTDALQDKFGRPAINRTAHEAAGMSESSALKHMFGCLGRASNPLNTLTLADVAKLYEQVERGRLMSQASRNTF